MSGNPHSSTLKSTVNGSHNSFLKIYKIFILLILFVMTQDLNYISSVCLKFTMYTYHFILELIDVCWSLTPQS